MITCIVFRGLLGAPVLLRKDGVGSLWMPKSLPALIYIEVGVRVGLSHSLSVWRLGVDWQRRLLASLTLSPFPIAPLILRHHLTHHALEGDLL